jgi:hypothetical protein
MELLLNCDKWVQLGQRSKYNGAFKVHLTIFTECDVRNRRETPWLDMLLTAVFNGALVKAATETTRVARIASFILLYR